MKEDKKMITSNLKNARKCAVVNFEIVVTARRPTKNDDDDADDNVAIIRKNRLYMRRDFEEITFCRGATNFSFSILEKKSFQEAHSRKKSWESCGRVQHVAVDHQDARNGNGIGEF